MTNSEGASAAAAPLLVLGKITDILNAFSLETPVLTLAQIRASTGLPGSTTQRLVTNLVSQGFLDRDDDRFRVGLRMAYWAAPAVRGMRVIDQIAPILRRLRDETGETASLFRSADDYRVCIAVEETHHELRQDSYVGKVAPLGAGSAGRVLLAWNDDLRADILSRPLPSLASQTVTDVDALAAALDETREHGFAITRNERVDGLAGLAAPIFEPGGEVRMAINLSGPAARMTPDRLDGWAPAVVAAATEATRLLGGRTPS